MLRNSKKEFIYVLKLVPRLTKVENWTSKDNMVVELHFKYLKEMLSEGNLILAGKTDGIDEATFGIVIIRAYTEEEARVIMENDPSVKEGIMISELYPYKVALRCF